MNTTKTICAALVATLGFATAAQARDWNNEGHADGRAQAQRNEQRHAHSYNDQGQQQQRYQRGSQGAYAQRSYVQGAQQVRPYAYAQSAQSAPQYSAYNRPYNGTYDRTYNRTYDRTYNRAYDRPYDRSWSGYAPQYGGSRYGAYSYANAPRYWAGGYVPYPYRAQRYWVNDWQARHLYAPPYGYQWVETDTGDVLLMALATGLIASVILSQ